MKKIFALSAALLASVSVFAFQPGETDADVKTEAAQRLKAETLDSIAVSAKTANISVDAITAALMAGGMPAADVVTALIHAGYYASDVVQAAVNNGADRNAMNRVALAAAPSRGGFNGGNFGNNQNPTPSGGGHGGVSPT